MQIRDRVRSDAMEIAVQQGGVDPNGLGNDGNKPLHSVTRKDQDVIFRKLVELGADVQGKNKDGDMPLHIGAQVRAIGCVSEILDITSDPDAVNDDGDTPMSIAVVYGHYEVVKELLAYGADPNKQDLEGKTALHHSLFAGPRMVKLLLSSEWTSEVFAELEKKRNSPDFVHYPVFIKSQDLKELPDFDDFPDLLNYELGDLLPNRSFIASLFKKLGIRTAHDINLSDPHIQDHMGDTALHFLIRSIGYDLTDPHTVTQMLSLLTNHQYLDSLSIINKDGYTPEGLAEQLSEEMGDHPMARTLKKVSVTLERLASDSQYRESRDITPAQEEQIKSFVLPENPYPKEEGDSAYGSRSMSPDFVRHEIRSEGGMLSDSDSGRESENLSDSNELSQGREDIPPLSKFHPPPSFLNQNTNSAVEVSLLQENSNVASSFENGIISADKNTSVTHWNDSNSIAKSSGVANVAMLAYIIAHTSCSLLGKVLSVSENNSLQEVIGKFPLLQELIDSCKVFETSDEQTFMDDYFLEDGGFSE